MTVGESGRDEVEEVMSRPEFHYPKSIMERVGDWIAERLEGLFDDVPGIDVPAGSFGGGVGSLLGWLLVVVALALVVFVVVFAVRHWVPRASDDAELLSAVETEHRRAAAQWRKDAEAHEAAGEWKLAIRARYRELVRTLVDRRQLTDLAGLTTRELLADVDTTTPGAASDFESACLLFELPWYAHYTTGPVENARFGRHAEAVLDATVEAPLSSTASEVIPGRVEVMPEGGR